MSYANYNRRPVKQNTYKPKTNYVRKTPVNRTAMVVPGYTRTGGFYGRYKKPNTLASQSVELKFFDTAMSGNVDLTAEIPATGGQICLISQGDSQSQRDGRKCVIKSVLFKGTFQYVPGISGTATAASFWLFLVLDKQCNGAAAAVTDVFTSTDMATAFHNIANSDRFQVLKKIRRTLTSQAGVGGAFGNVTSLIEFYKKCNVPVQYSSTTGAITEIKSNNIFYIWGCDIAAADDNITCNGTSRVRFVG